MTPTRPSLTGHQAKGGYLQPNSVTGLHPCVSPHTHPRAEDGAPRHPRQGSGPSLTEPSPTPPRPPRSNAASRRGAGSEAPEAAERGPAAAGPGPALTLTGRRLRQGRARPGSAPLRDAPGPGPAAPWQRLPAPPLTRAGLGLLQQRGAVLSLLGLHLAATRTAQRAQGQTAVRHR